MEKQIKIILEKHPDGYVAHYTSLKGVAVGQGNTYIVTLEDVRSAVGVPRFDIRGQVNGGRPARH